jgi:hypothetical protein
MRGVPFKIEISSNLTPVSPLQPALFVKAVFYTAGEGSLEERGRSPLSNSLPLSNIDINRI